MRRIGGKVRLSRSLPMAVGIVLFLIPSCTEYDSRYPKQLPAPPSVISNAEQAIIAKVGEEFFELNFTYLPDQSRIRTASEGEEYYLVWHFRVFGKPYIENLVSMRVDAEGKNLRGDIISGVPDCVADPGACEFAVDRQQAIELAKKAGLDKGIRPWTSRVEWRSTREKQGYVWAINSWDGTMGRNAYVDINDGSVELGPYEMISF